jgi:hypothetical protein
LGAGGLTLAEAHLEHPEQADHSIKEVTTRCLVKLASRATGRRLGSCQAYHLLLLGVAKVNCATLKQSSLAATREKLVNYPEPRNAHPSLGIGGRDDASVAGREAVKLKVKE